RNGIALCRERKAEIGFVDPHQRLTGFYLLPDIHEPFHDLAGDAKAEIALDPRPYDAGEAAVGSGHPRRRHEPDDRWLLPRVADGGSFLRAKEKCAESGRPERREHDASEHNSGSLFHGRRLSKL